MRIGDRRGRRRRAAYRAPLAFRRGLASISLAALVATARSGRFSAEVAPRLARLAFSASIRSMILVCGASRLGRDLLAVHLLLDGFEHPLAHGVAIVLGTELVDRRLLDEKPRQRELAVLHRRFRPRHVVRAPELRVIVELLHHEEVAHRPHQHEILLAAGGVLTQRRAAGHFERLRPATRTPDRRPCRGRESRPSRGRSGRPGRERHELGDVDRVGRLLVEGLDLLGREADVLALGELVALADLVLLDHRAFLRADVLLLEPRAAGGVQHVEADARGGLTRGKQVDRDGDQAEGDRRGPDGSGSHRGRRFGVGS